MAIPVDRNSTILESNSAEISPAVVDTVGVGHQTENIDPEVMPELVPDGFLAREGDILEQLDKNAVGPTWLVKTGYVFVAYKIDNKLAHREKDILAAFQGISQETCVSFHAHKAEMDYLLFTYAYGCASYLGKRGGMQPVYIGDRCKIGNIIHEIMHALGFHHEHMRKDRDKHITVIYENILPEKKRNFAKVHGNTQGLPYDTGSIMHYGQHFFSCNGKETITSKNGEPIGQRIHLSLLDVQRVQLLYKCDMGNASELTTAAPLSTSTEEQTTISKVTSAPVQTQLHLLH
ncbi:hypothetical protein COCON_G00168250 [Conger conger]|uniref:Metalloendopeptidase n=1 Tax=Conger conger TaxID=82655 RepID=A0A9Q1D799_CONCO|nr:hypothetical protein COCON_G00168250 [Conger conger]